MIGGIESGSRTPSTSAIGAPADRVIGWHLRRDHLGAPPTYRGSSLFNAGPDRLHNLHKGKSHETSQGRILHSTPL